MAGQCTNNNHSNNDATIKNVGTLVHSHSALYSSCTVTKNVLHLHLQSYRHPETGSTTICCCSDHGLHYLPRWSESVGISPRGVRRIRLPSITDKYSPVKRLFPLEWWHKNKSLISAAGPGRAAQPLLCLLNPSGSTICLALYLLASKTSLVHNVQWGSTVVWGHQEIMKALQWAQFAGLWCAPLLYQTCCFSYENKILLFLITACLQYRLLSPFLWLTVDCKSKEVHDSAVCLVLHPSTERSSRHNKSGGAG